MSLEQSEASTASDRPPEPAEGVDFRQLSIDVLDRDHRELFTRAISRVLATDIAEVSYAQILDGLPLRGVICDTAGGLPPDGHPIYHDHDELCPAVTEKTREFRDNFDPQILDFNSSLLFAYQAAAPGSRAFNTRLIEMMAVAVHQIAVILFKLDTSLHKSDGITDWAPPESDELFWYWFPKGPLPTLFSHPWYVDHDQYPNGAADMIGYWAESRILGGVVLFDRREQGADPNAVYWHSDRDGVTYRIYELRPEQKQVLIDFLSADSPRSGSPLPILGDDGNRNRVDPEEPIEATGIYRDRWERRERPPVLSDERLRDVWDGLDFPTLVDKSAAYQRARDQMNRFKNIDDRVEG